VKKILNRRKVQGKVKYLVRWKGFTAEGDTWEIWKNLKNAGDLLRKFKKEYRRDNCKVRRQEKEEDDREYSRRGFSGWYTARRLYGWSDGEYNKQY